MTDTASTQAQDEMRQMFHRHGAFFAFNNSQFEKSRKPGVTYVRVGDAGLLCPKENAGAVLQELGDIHLRMVARDLEQNTREEIILRELNNHECFYTGDISDVEAALVDYNATPEEIWGVYNKHQEDQNGL